MSVFLGGSNNLTLKNGWHTGSATHTNLKAIGSFSGNVGYCIEPGVHLSMGQSMTQYDENYFNNIQANGVISGDEIRQYIGRILQYGYRGTISTSWRSQNEAAAMLTIKKKFGKNAILKGMNLQEGATAKDRNEQIGGHKA